MTTLVWGHLVLFAALVLFASLHVLTASGHFPVEHRSADLRDGFGAAILFGSIALVLASVAWGIWSVFHVAPWYGAIIAGGAAVLFAPLLLIPLPDTFVNGRGALVGFAAACFALAVLLAALVP